MSHPRLAEVGVGLNDRSDASLRLQVQHESEVDEVRARSSFHYRQYPWLTNKTADLCLSQFILVDRIAEVLYTKCCTSHGSGMHRVSHLRLHFETGCGGVPFQR
jgi:hypothetical protein